MDAVFPPRATERLARSAQANAAGAEAALQRRHEPIRVCAVERALTGAGGRRVLRARAYALLPYADPLVAALVQEAKFHGSAPAARCLGGVLRGFLHELPTRAPECFPALLVPVPLSRERRKARGYNQAERIARVSLRSLKNEGPFTQAVLAPDLLRRVRDTLPQTSRTGTGRRANLAGAFQAAAPLDPRPTYIVVDDVVTTGQTLIHACRALADAGARRVIAVALAHATGNATVGKSGDVAEWSKAPHC